ncbi:MAG: SagB/ThcOx family dehydrogenase [Acidobacteria bacterium]|nr:SagB/ThcOx family dehydrogenase [Acidobacteriota bacterium]
MRDQSAAWKYHEATKHSYWSVRSGSHYLDWPNQPIPFKLYQGLDHLALPPVPEPAGRPVFELMSGAQRIADREVWPDMETLARLLHWSAGITRRRKYPGGEMLFRAAACTGALYEVELYIVCGDIGGLPAGVYHFGPKDHALRQLRAGDHRAVLADASAAEPAVVEAPVTMVCTCTYWRNAWKYQARTYRHFGWDNGTLLANLLAVSTGMNLPARLVLGFVDEEINRLLGLDPLREVTFSMVALGRGANIPSPHPEALPALGYQIIPLSERETDYPIMREIHEASSLSSPEEVARWRGGSPVKNAASLADALRLPGPGLERDPGPPIEQVILRRGSTRRFSREEISFEQLSSSLFYASRGIDADFLEPFGVQLNAIYLIVNAVEGAESGAYVYDRRAHALGILKQGDFRQAARHLGLDQDLPGDASVAVFFMADLKDVFARYGERGYRAVQLEAGILGGRLYLTAYAQGLGATGLTFYDDEAVDFFSPHAAGKSAIFLMALGKRFKPPVRKA